MTALSDFEKEVKSVIDTALSHSKSTEIDEHIKSSIERQISIGHKLIGEKCKTPRNVISADQRRGLHHIEPSRLKFNYKRSPGPGWSQSSKQEDIQTSLNKVTQSEFRNRQQQYPPKKLLRSHSSSPCPIRVAQLAAPNKRHCLETLRAKSYMLPPPMAERLISHVYDQTPIVQVAHAAEHFRSEKMRKSNKSSPTRGKNMMSASGTLLIEMRNFCVIFSHHVAQKLKEPFCANLEGRMKMLSDAVSSEISKIMKDDDDLGNLDRNFAKNMHNEVSERVSVWMVNILERAAQLTLEDDLKAKNIIVRQPERKLKEDQVVTWIGQDPHDQNTSDSSKIDLEEEEGPVLDFLDGVMDNVMKMCETNSDDDKRSQDGSKTPPNSYDGNHESKSDSNISDDNSHDSSKSFKDIYESASLEYIKDGTTGSDNIEIADKNKNNQAARTIRDVETEPSRNSKKNVKINAPISDTPISVQGTDIINNNAKLLSDSDSETGSSSNKTQVYLPSLSDEDTSRLFEKVSPNRVTKEVLADKAPLEIYNFGISTYTQGNSKTEIPKSTYELHPEVDFIESVEIKEHSLKNVNELEKIKDITAQPHFDEERLSRTNIPEVFDFVDRNENDKITRHFEVLDKISINDNVKGEASIIIETTEIQHNVITDMIHTAPTETVFNDTSSNHDEDTNGRSANFDIKPKLVHGREDIDTYLNQSYQKSNESKDNLFHILDDASLEKDLLHPFQKVNVFINHEQGGKESESMDILNEVRADHSANDNQRKDVPEMAANSTGKSTENMPSAKHQVKIFSEAKQSLISDMDDEWPAKVSKSALRLSVSKSVLNLGNIKENDEIERQNSTDSGQNKIQSDDIAINDREQKVVDNIDTLLAISNEIHDSIPVKLSSIQDSANMPDVQVTSSPIYNVGSMNDLQVRIPTINNSENINDTEVTALIQDSANRPDVQVSSSSIYNLGRMSDLQVQMPVIHNSVNITDTKLKEVIQDSDMTGVEIKLSAIDDSANIHDVEEKNPAIQNSDHTTDLPAKLQSIQDLDFMPDDVEEVKLPLLQDSETLHYYVNVLQPGRQDSDMIGVPEKPPLMQDLNDISGGPVKLVQTQVSYKPGVVSKLQEINQGKNSCLQQQIKPSIINDEKNVELLITMRNHSLQKQKELLENINIYTKIDDSDTKNKVLMEGDQLKIRLSRTKPVIKQAGPPQRKLVQKSKINYNVDPKNAPSWARKSKESEGNIWPYSKNLQTVNSVEIRDWAKVLEKFSLDIASWSQWVDAVCHEVYDMTKDQEVFERPNADANKENMDQWTEFRDRVEQQALKWRKLNLQAKRGTEKLQRMNIPERKVMTRQPRTKSPSFLDRERRLMNTLDDIDKWSTWIHSTVVATEHVMKTDSKSNESYDRWRHLRNVLNNESQEWQEYHKRVRSNIRPHHQIGNGREKEITNHRF